MIKLNFIDKNKDLILDEITYNNRNNMVVIPRINESIDFKNTLKTVKDIRYKYDKDEDDTYINIYI